MIHGVPTALSSREIRALQDLARGRKVVEAGALLGGSTIIMARVALSIAYSLNAGPRLGRPEWVKFLKGRYCPMIEIE